MLVGWDTLGVPTYRNEAFPAYQSGRVFDDALARAARPAARSSSRRWASRPRRRPATRPTTSSPPAVASEEARGGDDAGRDLRPRRVPARQRADDDPAAREGRLRARPDRPRGGAGALRRRAGAGAGLHRAARRPVRQAPGRPRRRPEDGGGDPAPSTARWRPRSRRAASPRSGGAAALPANRDDGRLCPSPLPSRPNRRTGRRRPLSASPGASATSPAGWRRWRPRPDAARWNSSATRRSPSSTRPAPSRVAAAAGRAARGGRLVEGDVPGDGGAGRALPHGRPRRPDPRPERPDLARRRHAGVRDELRGSAARRRRGNRGRLLRRVRARPPARAPRARRPGDGLLPLQQRRDRGTRARRPSSGSSASRSSTGTSTTATGRRTSSGTTPPSSTSRSTSGRSTPAPGGPGERRRDDGERPAPGRVRRTRSTCAPSSRSSSRPCAGSSPTC